MIPKFHYGTLCSASYNIHTKTRRHGTRIHTAGRHSLQQRCHRPVSAFLHLYHRHSCFVLTCIVGRVQLFGKPRTADRQHHTTTTITVTISHTAQVLPSAPGAFYENRFTTSRYPFSFEYTAFCIYVPNCDHSVDVGTYLHSKYL